MASFYAELEVTGHTYPVRACQFSFTQATDERGRVRSKVRHGLVHLTLDVPPGDFLLHWGTTAHKPLAGHVTFFETSQRTARETMSFAAGECVGYHETFEAGDGEAGAYVCHLTIAAPKLVLSAGGPLRPFIPPAPRDYVHIPSTPLSPITSLMKPEKTSVPEVNLRLGANEIYRDSIILASERTGLDAAAIACIIDAEAAKKPSVDSKEAVALGKKALKAKKKARKNFWDPDSQNADSTAKGLTQFIDGTWLEMAKKPGTLLNERAKELGYINEKNKLVSDHVDSLLDLRKNSELSIVTAAEYGKGNLEKLQQNGLNIANTTDDEKAKLIYLAHHEGATGATEFLQNSMSEESAQKKLAINLGRKNKQKIEDAIKKHGSAKEAYQDFLRNYTNKVINPDNFRSTPLKSFPSGKEPLA